VRTVTSIDVGYARRNQKISFLAADSETEKAAYRRQKLPDFGALNHAARSSSALPEEAAKLPLC
jgi:hypothetical protein